MSANSITGLFNQLFDNKMESFETAFPAKIKTVNEDGTVDVVPSIKNVLKNMQMEPTDSEGNLNAVYGVPVLFPGTASAIIEFELKAGDPVLCIASSRDLRTWIEGAWDSDKPFEPLSFSGNDLNDLIAIPMRRKKHSTNSTRIFIDSNGAVLIDTTKKVILDSKYVGVKGDLVVEGNVKAGGDIVAMSDQKDISLSNHVHPTAVGPSLVAPNGIPIPIPEPA